MTSGGMTKLNDCGSFDGPSDTPWELVKSTSKAGSGFWSAAPSAVIFLQVSAVFELLSEPPIVHPRVGSIS